jgi:hypothetical protein
MRIERELLRRISSHSESRIPAHFIYEIQELLAQPEQTKRSPLTEAEISKTLKLSRRSTEWDYGFEAGVRFAEEFHGIEL